MFCSCFNYINCLSFSQNINHYCSQKDVPPKKVPEVDQELGEGESFVILRPPPPGNQKITNPRSMRGGGGEGGYEKPLCSYSSCGIQNLMKTPFKTEIYN